MGEGIWVRGYGREDSNIMHANAHRPFLLSLESKRRRNERELAGNVQTCQIAVLVAANLHFATKTKSKHNNESCVYLLYLYYARERTQTVFIVA